MFVGRSAPRLLFRPSHYRFLPSTYGFCSSKQTENVKELSPAKPEDIELACASPPRMVGKRGVGCYEFRILGDESQSLQLSLAPGESIRGEIGSMIFMGMNIEMNTDMHGGFTGALKRKITGDSFFMSDFKNIGEKNSEIKFGANYPSKVLPINLSAHGGKLIAQQGAFLVGDPSVKIEMYTQHSLKTGFFGGEGFILQELQGSGQVFLKGGGSVSRLKLEADEKIQVSPGSLIAFEETVKYDTQMLKGLKNIAFAGEGLFLGTLEGPGIVWIQSLPFSKLMNQISRSVSSSSGFGIPLGGRSGSSDQEENTEEGNEEEPAMENSADTQDSVSENNSSSGSWIGGSWFGEDNTSTKEESGGSWFGGMFDGDGDGGDGGDGGD